MSTLQTGGLCRFSSIDWPGRLVAVVFVQGCPWRCVYCHNPGLQAREPTGPGWPELEAWLPSRLGLLDGVVFSGGEPLLDAGLPAALKRVRAMGFKTGLHTAGIYPERLQAVSPLLDWVGLDLKAALDEEGSYGRIAGAPAARQAALRSLALVLEAHRRHGLDYECRTTWHPEWLGEDELLRLARQLRVLDVRHWVLQQARPTPRWRPTQPAHGAQELESLLARLRDEVPGLALRQAA